MTLCFACCLVLLGTVSLSASEKPNIIVILADDLGYGDLGTYGATLIRTPELDAMASEGVRLTGFYASANVCTPSRAGLLTGRYPIRMGLANKTIEIKDKRGLPGEEVTLAEVLKQDGYHTAVIGKWHLGHAFDRHWPDRHGFDYFFGHHHPNEYEQALYRDHEVIEKHPINQNTLTKRYTAEVRRFIREHQREPFFIFLAHTMPHIYLHASENFADRSRAGRFGDAVEEIDWSTGEILAELEQLGIDNRTLVIFTSDNGPFPEGSTGGLRGGKGTPWEGGYRVPMIARWPGKIPAGMVNDAMAMNIDLLPTIASVTGSAVPGQNIIDGKNIFPMLVGNNATPHEVLYFFHNDRIAALRHGEWRLVLSDYPPWRNARPFLFERTRNRHPLLFNLGIDRDERFDLSRNEPAVFTRLWGLLERGRRELESLSSYTDEEMYQVEKLN